jgi:hypothetical protein
MVPDLLLLTAALCMLFLVPVIARQALSMSRVVVVSYGVTVSVISIVWLGWLLLSWGEPRW